MITPKIILLVLLAAPSGGERGTIEGRVTVKLDGKVAGDQSGVVVSLEGLPAAAIGEAKTVTQKNIQFEPDLTVVIKGGEIAFPNEDKIFHNVFSLSRASRFDLGLYKSGASKTVRFEKTGSVDVYCNIHPEMQAKIRVVENEYFAVTAADGTFRISGVPAGEYPIVAWSPDAPEYRGTVKIAAGKVTQLSFELVKSRSDRRHTRKDGTPYGRYR